MRRREIKYRKANTKSLKQQSTGDLHEKKCEFSPHVTVWLKWIKKTPGLIAVKAQQAKKVGQD